MPAPAPSPLRLDHVVVPVHDASAARAFYGDTLGLPLVEAVTGDDWGGHPWLMMIFALGTSGQHLVATALAGIDSPATSPLPRDARHHALAVPSADDWARWKSRLTAARADFWEESHGPQRSLYVVDPSGNVLELTTPETPAFSPTPTPTGTSTPTETVTRWLAQHAPPR